MGVYWNTLPNDFVAGDRQFILRNPHLGNYQTVLHSFTSDYWGKLGGESFIYYRPMTILSHFIDFTLYGLNPAGHHFSNMVFHTIVTLLVYQLFFFLFSSNPWIALVGASLFALHPIHTHSVSYVMGRTDVLAALFYLSGLNLLIGTNHQKKGHIKGWKIAGACVCYFFHLLVLMAFRTAFLERLILLDPIFLFIFNPYPLSFTQSYRRGTIQPRRCYIYLVLPLAKRMYGAYHLWILPGKTHVSTPSLLLQ